MRAFWVDSCFLSSPFTEGPDLTLQTEILRLLEVQVPAKLKSRCWDWTGESFESSGKELVNLCYSMIIAQLLCCFRHLEYSSK